jgi:hypothetical protein
MPRIAIVSRNPTLAWGLGSTGHDLIEVRPHQVDRWLEDAAHTALDLVVLDLDDSGRSLTVLTSLRAQASMTPVLLVAGSDEGWSSPTVAALPGAEVLPLPITSTSLQAAVGRLLADDATGELTDDTAEHEGSDGSDSEPAASSDSLTRTETPAAESGHVGPEGGTPEVVVPVQPTRSARPALRRSPRTADSVRKALSGADFSAQVASVAAVSEVPAETESTQPEPSGAPRSNEPWPDPPPGRSLDSANALARALILRRDELYGVPETAEVIVLDAADRVGAEATALLLPDGRRWRVAAGTGLSGVEARFELEEDSWVVERVARSSKGVIVEDTDVARRPFQRAPLSSRKHLLAAPIALVEGVLLAARDSDRPFNEKDLAALAGLAAEAGLLLAAALDVRELARALDPYRDLD